MSADYTAWRITYQSSEQAAQAAYRAAREHLARCAQLEAVNETLRQAVSAAIRSSQPRGVSVPRPTISGEALSLLLHASLAGRE